MPPPARSSSPLPWILGGVGLVVLLLVLGCVVGVVRMTSRARETATTTAGERRAPAPPPPAGPSIAGPGRQSPSRKAAAAGPLYAVDVDYCPKLTYTVLGEWAMTQQKAEPRKGGTGLSGSYKVTCTTDFRNGGTGRFSTVITTAEIYESAEDAQEAYQSHRDFDRGRFDKDLTGYGDEAYGTYRTWTPGWPTSEYEVQARSGNLFLSTHVSVSQDKFIPKETMEPKVGAQAKAALALVPKK